MNIIEYLRSRGVDPDSPGIMLDLDNDLAHFLLYNLSGELVGYQRLNPTGDKADHSNSLDAKYYTWLTKEDRKIAKLGVWGLDRSDLTLPYLIVTEGIFDAARAHNAGHPAIALLANDPKHLRSWLRSLGKTIIAVIDNDPAGQKLRDYADRVIEVEGGKDLGDLTDEEARELLGVIDI